MSSKKKTSVRPSLKRTNKSKTDPARKAPSDPTPAAPIQVPAQPAAAAPSSTGAAAIRTGSDAKAAKGPAPKRMQAGKRDSEHRAGGLTAAHRILSAAKEPMRIRDITKAAMGQGLWTPAGKTPWATLAAAIGREIKLKGKSSRFKKTDRGLFTAVQPK